MVALGGRVNKIEAAAEVQGKVGRRFNVKLLQEGSNKADFLNTFMKCFDTKQG